jgi:exopolysaccharide biosynthesis polyprenyl glycosylphosphotransferase
MTVEAEVTTDARPARASARAQAVTQAGVSYLPSATRDTFDAAAPSPTMGRAPWERRYLSNVIALDVFMATLAGPFGYLLRFDNFETQTRLRYLGFAGCLPLLWVLLMALNRTYSRRFLYIGSEETRRVFRSGIMLVAGVAFISYASNENFSRGYMLGSFPLLVVGTAIGRYVLRKRLHGRRATGACMERTIVVGHPGPTAAMVARLRRQQHHGLDVVAAALPPGVETDESLADTDLPLVHARGIVDAVTNLDADVVVVLACPEMDGDELRRLSWRLESTGAQLLVAPALVDVTGPRTSVRLAAGLPLLYMEPPEFSGFKRFAKTALDRSAAALGLLLLSPLLLAVVVMIRLDDHGKAVFKQKRVGRHGKEFVLLKFRTMHVDAESRLASLRQLNENDGVLFKMRADPRVTRVGRYLRRFSLDELPQLINVLRGEMSLVGPRPPLPSEVSRYEPDLRRRLVVPPGLTGLWQVSGRSDLSWDESMYLDLHYVENWSPALDLMILVKTARAVVQARGAY